MMRTSVRIHQARAQAIQRTPLQAGYLYLRHAQDTRCLLLRQPLEKAQQDRQLLPLRQRLDSLAQRNALHHAVLWRFAAKCAFERQAVPCFPLQTFRYCDRQLALRDLLNAQACFIRELGERRLASKGKAEPFTCGKNQRRLLTDASADLDCTVIPQQYLPLCAGMAVKAGMDPFDALRAITIHPAEHIGIADRVGSLEAGKDADLVITDGSPFEVSTTVRRVLIGGKTVHAV